MDVIHTNIGRYGVLFSDAHYDIYANEGVNQPGCNKGIKSCLHVHSIKPKHKTFWSTLKFFEYE